MFNETIVSALVRHCKKTPNKVLFRFVDGKGESSSVTFRELDFLASNIATNILASCNRGDRALLLLTDEKEFILAFIGCLYAGVVPVPVSVPSPKRGIEHLVGIIKDSDAFIVIHSNSKLEGSLLESNHELVWLNLGGLTAFSEEFTPSVSAQDIAFIQYTSGSTGHPKGVVVTHDSLIENEIAITQGMGLDSDSKVVSWLPLYHDMGLIGSVLQPLYLGAECIIISSSEFIKTPALWLQTISKYKATTTGGPNFCLDICVDRILEASLEGVVLDSLSVLFVGAEPIRQTSLERFYKKFNKFGFKREAFFPCYGMAEATLYISGSSCNEEPKVLRVCNDALKKGWAKLHTGKNSDFSDIVSCGSPVKGTELYIVNPETRAQVKDGEVGEIFVRSKGNAKKYFGKEKESLDVFNVAIRSFSEGELPGFLRTGDLGFLYKSQLYVTGREKDLIIIRGKNYFPQDLEFTCQSSSSFLAEASVAAFSINEKGEEKLVLVQELTREGWRHAQEDKVKDCIRDAVVSNHGVSPFIIYLIKPGTIPRTTSGKIRRAECRNKVEKAQFDILREGVLVEEVQA